MAAILWSRLWTVCHRGCEPSFCQRTRLCVSPSDTSMAAILIGAPMPSTTGAPSSAASHCGFICTGHWVFPMRVGGREVTRAQSLAGQVVAIAQVIRALLSTESAFRHS
jgi:hypothetical protein